MMLVNLEKLLEGDKNIHHVTDSDTKMKIKIGYVPTLELRYLFCQSI